MSKFGDNNEASQPLTVARDSLELGSLASSEQSADAGLSSPSGPPSSRRGSFGDDDPLSESKEARRARMNRSYSVSSAFDFAAPLFPLASATPGYTALGDPSGEAGLGVDSTSLDRQKTLTYLKGLSLVVGLIIGTAIFSSPAQVNRNAGSPAAALGVWLIAGLLAWTGAASYAELGGAIPLNGGAQVYISKIYGNMAGFLYSWFTVCVIKPGSAAIIAIIFGEYLVRGAIGPDAEDASVWVNKAVALAGSLLVTLLNAISTKVASKSADVFMVFKFVALLGVTITGVVVAITGASWKGNASDDWKTHNWVAGTDTDLSHWAVAVYAALWAFDGWDNVSNRPIYASNLRLITVLGELRDRRVYQPHSRPSASYPHVDAASYCRIPIGKHELLSCPAVVSDFDQFDDCYRFWCSSPGITGLIDYGFNRCRQWIRLAQRISVHQQSIVLCRRKRGLSTLNHWDLGYSRRYRYTHRPSH